MRLVIADTGPINYLIQIGHIELLPRMFEKVALPGRSPGRTVQTSRTVTGPALDRSPSRMA